METEPTTTNALLPLAEVARRLSCSKRHVWRLIANGELAKTVQVGRKACLFVADLDAYFERLMRNRDQIKRPS